MAGRVRRAGAWNIHSASAATGAARAPAGHAGIHRGRCSGRRAAARPRDRRHGRARVRRPDDRHRRRHDQGDRAEPLGHHAGRRARARSLGAIGDARLGRDARASLLHGTDRPGPRRRRTRVLPDDGLQLPAPVSGGGRDEHAHGRQHGAVRGSRGEALHRRRPHSRSEDAFDRPISPGTRRVPAATARARESRRSREDGELLGRSRLHVVQGVHAHHARAARRPRAS
jgi:hypothetical protein